MWVISDSSVFRNANHSTTQSRRSTHVDHQERRRGVPRGVWRRARLSRVAFSLPSLQAVHNNRINMDNFMIDCSRRAAHESVYLVPVVMQLLQKLKLVLFITFMASAPQRLA